MKEEIFKILSIKEDIDNYNSLILDKENDILSCTKSINEGNVSLKGRQKQAAYSLLNLKKKKEKLNKELYKSLRGLDLISFEEKKMTNKMIYKCIGEGIGSQELKVLKELYKR